MERKIIFAPENYYHIYNRTILNVPEFENYEHANKLAQCFLLANSTESALAFEYLRRPTGASWHKAIEIAWRGDKLVDIISYAIMPDHYHLLIKELKENGTTSFLRRCNTAVAKYINTKNNRKGPLFESCFKAKHIDSNAYLLHLSLYIHLNPLDFIDGKNWRMGKIKNWPLAKKGLLKYPWSSLKNFLNDEKEDLILSGTEIISNQFRNKKEYEKFLTEWSTGNLEQIKDLIIAE